MTWETSPDVGEFLARADGMLTRDPVRNTVLLTEAHFWRRLSDPPIGARFGWWVERDAVRAGFVHVPEHDPLCSPLTAASAAALPHVLADGTGLGVDERDVDAVVEAWRVVGRSVRPRRRVTVLRLGELRTRELPEGISRVAYHGDLPLLRDWFRMFQERFPTDPSHVEFVIDHPLEEGGIVIWEVEGRPVAMSSRTPEVGGMVRMGLAFQPDGGSSYAQAAFAVGCAEARTARHVLVLSGSPELAAVHRALGFAPVLDRVVLDLGTA